MLSTGHSGPYNSLLKVTPLGFSTYEPFAVATPCRHNTHSIDLYGTSGGRYVSLITHDRTSYFVQPCAMFFLSHLLRELITQHPATERGQDSEAKATTLSNT